MAWEIDQAHSQVTFNVKHMMISTVRGRFNQFSGILELDERTPANSRVDVTVDAASVDTNEPRRDGHLRSADFFDVANYPTITFKSTRVEIRDDEHARVYGDLTIHGVTHEVPLDVTLEGHTRDMQGQRRSAYVARGTITRSEFGLNWNVALEAGGWLVGDKINVEIEAEVLEPAAAPTAAQPAAR
jgi:polyisoprenoid-binding protein YceI